jgi:hypothetical protein
MKDRRFSSRKKCAVPMETENSKPIASLLGSIRTAAPHQMVAHRATQRTCQPGISSRKGLHPLAHSDGLSQKMRCHQLTDKVNEEFGQYIRVA